MIPEMGFKVKVVGRMSDIAAAGPNPGSTPTSVPARTPMKQKSKFVGCRATLNPIKAFCHKSIAVPQKPKMPLGSCA